MIRSRTALACLVGMLFLPARLLAQPPAPPAQASPPTARDVAKTATQRAAAVIDPDVEKIKDEGLKRSQVMATLSHLSDVIGPRLTASPNMKRANEWTRDKLGEWGLQDSHLEAW